MLKVDVSNITVTITFPCSDDDWESLLSLRNITNDGAEVSSYSEFNKKNSEKNVAKDFPKSKFNRFMAREVRDYVKKNSGCLFSEVVEHIMTTFSKNRRLAYAAVHSCCYKNEVKVRRFNEKSRLADRLYPHI
jgi:hypothetical protein